VCFHSVVSELTSAITGTGLLARRMPGAERPSIRRATGEGSLDRRLAFFLPLDPIFGVASNVVIPCPPYEWFVLINQLSDIFNLLTARAIRLRQHNWIHPEFGIVLGILNVNVDWFLRFTAEKQESVSLISENF